MCIRDSSSTVAAGNSGYMDATLLRAYINVVAEPEIVSCPSSVFSSLLDITAWNFMTLLIKQRGLLHHCYFECPTCIPSLYTYCANIISCVSSTPIGTVNVQFNNILLSHHHYHRRYRCRHCCWCYYNLFFMKSITTT